MDHLHKYQGIIYSRIIHLSWSMGPFVEITYLEQAKPDTQ